MISLSQRRKTTKKEKRYMKVEELNRMVDEKYGPYERSQRSYELEKMDIKLKDLKNMTKEDVEELRIIHKDNIRYKIYFSWYIQHIPKVVALIGSLILFIYWYGPKALIAFLPITLVMAILLTFIRLTRGY